MTGFVTAGSGSEGILNASAHSNINHTGILGVGAGGGDAFPIGCIVPFGASVASLPGGWLPCDGTEYGRTGGDANPQPALFGIIGILWGIGDGVNSFNVPDLRARSLSSINDGTLPAGQAGGLSSRSVSATVGAETHSHTVNSHNHSISADGSHTHGGTTQFDAPSATGFSPAISAAGGVKHDHTFTTNSAGSHSHAGGTGNATPTTNAISSLGPTAFCPFIIKAVAVGGGAGGISAQVNAGTLQGPQPTINLIEGAGVSITAVENIPQNRNDVTVNALVPDAETESVTVGTGLSQTRSVPGGTLGVDNERLEFTAWGVVSGAGGDVSVSFGAQTIITGVTVGASGSWRVSGTIVRTGASSQEIIAEGVGGSGGITRTVGTSTLAVANNLVATSTTGDVFALVVSKWKA